MKHTQSLVCRPDLSLNLSKKKACQVPLASLPFALHPKKTEKNVQISNDIPPFEVVAFVFQRSTESRIKNHANKEFSAKSLLHVVNVSSTAVVDH